MSHVYCPECGFQNPEAANYCSKCGILLVHDEIGSETTMSFSPEEVGASASTVQTDGPSLVVRAGGGRAGEAFPLRGERFGIGRSPDCEVFLDDVTVSRRHAQVSRREDGSLWIEDQGSLNGTFLNRRRVESAKLEDGDELQIGKYRLAFLVR